MAKDPNKPRKARKGLSEVKPKQRLNYVSIRIGEITNELERLKVVVGDQDLGGHDACSVLRSRVVG